MTELRVVRHVGLMQLVRSAIPARSTWSDELPVQSVRRLAVPNLPDDSEDFREVAQRVFGRAPGGRHTVYLDPATLQSGPLAQIAATYPADAGLKVLRTPGSLDEAEYLFGTGHSGVQRALTHPLRQLGLVANRLYAADLGPRLYDLVELETASRVRVAFVVRHCAGKADRAQAAECVESIRRLVASHELGVVTPGGFDHMDFRAPDYADNVGVDSAGRAVYLDFQNFTLLDYGDFLETLATAAAADTHFGDRSLLRGGSYLYQNVPGLARSGKRNIGTRGLIIDRILAEAGVSLDGRVVIDFGCNIGMMMAEYLRRGAAWCSGYDLPKVVQHAEKLLLATGCTRFSLIGGTLGSTTDALATLPPHTHSLLGDSLVSYLAIRGHVGWLPTLGTLPWTYLLYEGHENESMEQSLREFDRLAATAPVEVVSKTTYRDGDSRDRTVALLHRRG